MTNAPRKRRSWATAVTFGLVAGFVAVAVTARFNPTWAAQVKGSDSKAPAAKEATKTKKKAAPVVLQVPGAGQKLDAHALSKIIDQEVAKKLSAESITASALSSDSEFIRRVYLDIVGVIPTADKVKAFLESKEPNKRTKLIDELLADPRFGTSLAELWSTLMIPRESNNRLLKYTPLQKWLADSFNAGKPVDKLVYELLTATGTQDENGAVTFFVGNPSVDKMTDNVARMFLGVQLQCAQCHNHPFTDWKQTEYWAMAAFFMKTRLSANPQQAAKKGVSPGISETNAAPKKKGGLPESAKIVPAKFLQGEQPSLNKSEPYRPVLAKWIADSKNPFFAKAMVNRFWYQYFGRGIVNPVDDMHEENPASHPELLAAMTEQFKTNGFDLKYLIRAICNSETYQRSSKPNDSNKEDVELFSHAYVRVLSGEQLYDSLSTVAGKANVNRQVLTKGVGGKKGPGTPRDNFLNFFRIDEGLNPLEYQQGIPQALRLMNSPQFSASADAISAATKAGNNEPAKVIEHLFLTAVARPPTQQELGVFTKHVSQRGAGNAAYGDVLWALLNSSEFALNH
jgi:hypothetical protein